MRLPCNFADNTYNRHLTKGLIKNYNANHEEKYCAIILKGTIQSRTVKQAEKLIKRNKNIEVLW